RVAALDLRDRRARLDDLTWRGDGLRHHAANWGADLRLPAHRARRLSGAPRCCELLLCRVNLPEKDEGLLAPCGDLAQLGIRLCHVGLRGSDLLASRAVEHEVKGGLRVVDLRLLCRNLFRPGSFMERGERLLGTRLPRSRLCQIGVGPLLVFLRGDADGNEPLDPLVLFFPLRY